MFISLYRSLWSISSSVEQAPHPETKEGSLLGYFTPTYSVRYVLGITSEEFRGTNSL